MAEPFLQHHRLLVSTLSPVHVGCGMDLDPTGYVMDRDFILLFEPADLPALPEWAQRRDELLKLLERNRGGELITGVQKLFHEMRASLAAVSRHGMPVAEGVARLYRDRIGQVAQRQGGGGRDINKFEIERAFHHPHSGRLIIPGSSIKGAVRTAVLNAAHGGRSLTSQGDAKRKKNQWKTLPPLDQTLKDYHPQDFARDPFRLLKIGDVAGVDPDLPEGEVLFAQNRTRQPQEKPGKNRSRLCRTVECLAEGLPRWGEGDLALHDLSQVPSQFQGKLPAQTERPTIGALVPACNAFYRPRLEQDLARPGVAGDWAGAVKGLLAGKVGARLEAEKAFLLRVGRHSGADSVTLDGARWIYRPQGKSWHDLPSTVWMASRSRGQTENLIPFGWLLVEVVPGDEAPEELARAMPDLQAWAAPHVQRRRERFQAMQARRDLRRREIDQAARERHEQERKAARERQRREEEEARVAAMTPNQRKVEGLRDMFDRHETAFPGKKQPISGEIWPRVRELLEDARQDHWTAEERRALYSLLNERFAACVELSKKKKPDYTAGMARLHDLIGGSG